MKGFRPDAIVMDAPRIYHLSKFLAFLVVEGMIIAIAVLNYRECLIAVQCCMTSVAWLRPRHSMPHPRALCDLLLPPALALFTRWHVLPRVKPTERQLHGRLNTSCAMRNHVS